MVKRVRKSKRIRLKDKYKVVRKVAEHRRKVRRENRKNHKNGVIIPKKKSKNLSLPNLLPYKEKFLKSMKKQKEMELNQFNQRQFDHRDQLLKERQDRLNHAEERGKTFDKQQEQKGKEEGDTKDTTKDKRMYLKEVKKVIELSDIILIVLDARDPLNCLSSIVEDILKKTMNKRLIYILNKIDLIPKENIDKWLKFLRQYHPTIPFKANTQKQNQNLSWVAPSSSSSDIALHENNLKICIGGDNLLQLIKNYSRQGDKGSLKSAVTVGVVGYPNVGKSSLINSLKRSKSVGVSSVPGYTKNLQIIQIDKKLKIIDSPGVLFHSEDHTRARKLSSLIFNNFININLVEDPVGSVQVVFETFKAKDQLEEIMLFYRLKKFNSAAEMIRFLAFKRGKLKKGGIPDTEAAARIILQDLNNGKLKYHTDPPEVLDQTDDDVEMIE